MVLSGVPLKKQGRRLSYRFEPGGETIDPQITLFGSGDEVTAWQFPAQFFSDKTIKHLRGAAAPEVPLDQIASYCDRFRQVRSLQINNGMVRDVVFELGSLDAPFAALDECGADLLLKWGIDPVSYKALRKGPEARSSPGQWVQPSDYPRDLVAKGIAGRIPFRLMVDRAGHVTECKVQAMNTDPRFEAAVCPMIRRRARFRPAIAADGAEVASVWTSAVLFLSN